MQKTYRAVLFDFGGVLIEDPTRKIYGKIRPTLTADKRSRFWELANNYALGELKHYKDLYKEISHLTGGKFSTEYVKKTYDEVEPNLKLLNFIKDKIKPKYKVAIVTNNGADYIAEWENKLKLDKTFNLFVISADIGIKKPDAQIYLQACMQLEVKPNECFFVDDNDEPLEGAKSVGMKPLKIDIDNTQAFISDFSKLYL